jgi:hypothetical protein
MTGQPVTDRSPDRGPSIRFQFGALTLFVGAFTLYVFFELLHQVGYKHLITITVANVVPWAIGLLQWKETTRKDDAQEGWSGNAAQKSIVRVLWVTYLVLADIEYLCLTR